MEQSGKRKIVGIDLGTTNSAIAHFDEYGKVDIIPNSDNERTTPSVVLFEDGEAIVGRVAKNLAVSNPERVIQFVKRHMGEDWSTEIDGHSFTPEVISAMILKRLVQDAETQLGERITDVVITCPAYFNDNERRLTRDAGRIAGLNVLGILNEPTAAALAYALNNLDKRVKALVFDLGGGTLDVTILEVKGNNVTVLASDGERLLGGKDWDDVLIEHAANAFQDEHGIDPRQDPEAFQDLIVRSEDAKKTLSTKPRARLFLQCQGKSKKVVVKQDEFEEMTSHLLKRCEASLGGVMYKAGLSWDDIDLILPVGGATRMPAVKDLLERVSSKTSEQWVNPDECVAVGAAYWAAILMLREAHKLKERARQKEAAEEQQAATLESESMELAVPEDMIVLLGETEVTNVNTHSLGVLAISPQGERTNRVMIKEQTPLPTKITREFVTQLDDQRSVEIRILEGDKKDPEACVDIGRCMISGLPPKRPKGSKIHVTYAYREDGIVVVHAKDVESGKSVKAQFTPTAARLTDDEASFFGRKIKDLLEDEVLGDVDSDEEMYRQFAEGYGDSDSGTDSDGFDLDDPIFRSRADN